MTAVVWLQSSTISCWQLRLRWATRTRRSRLYAAAWLKLWSPRTGWNRKWGSWWKCPSTVCRTTRSRPEFRCAHNSQCQTCSKKNETVIVVTWNDTKMDVNDIIVLNLMLTNDLCLTGTYEWEQKSSGPDLYAGKWVNFTHLSFKVNMGWVPRWLCVCVWERENVG